MTADEWRRRAQEEAQGLRDRGIPLWDGPRELCPPDRMNELHETAAEEEARRLKMFRDKLVSEFGESWREDETADQLFVRYRALNQARKRQYSEAMERMREEDSFERMFNNKGEYE